MADKVRAIANERAAYAFAKVKGVVNAETKKNNTQMLKEYRSYLKKMPAMVQVNGLGETLAFYYAKEGAYRVIYEQIAEWIKKSMGSLINKNDENKEFIEILVNMKSPEYRLVTMEVLALLNWMHRFAEGMIDVKQSKPEEQ